MTQKPVKDWDYYFFPRSQVSVPTKWDLLRKVAKKQATGKAQMKLEWIIFYHTIARKKVLPTARHFGISRKTLHKWLKRFDERDLTSLEEHFRAAKHTRTWMITKEQEERIISLRINNIEFGKGKLKILYQKAFHEPISTWKIERVVRKHRLYPDVVAHTKRVEKRKASQSKVRIHQVNDAIRKVQAFGFLWHIDAIIIWWYGERRIIFTALEECTKIAFARVYKSNTSGFAEDFLKRLMYLSEGRVEIIHSDNGSEFQGAFERACETLGIHQVYSRPHTPKDNPALERFNRTLQQEWLDHSLIGLDDIIQANHDLTLWLIKYNSYRPHQSLEYMTPLEYAQEKFFKVSPMWSANTTY